MYQFNFRVWLWPVSFETGPELEAFWLGFEEIRPNRRPFNDWFREAIGNYDWEEQRKEAGLDPEKHYQLIGTMEIEVIRAPHDEYDEVLSVLACQAEEVPAEYFELHFTQ